MSNLPPRNDSAAEAKALLRALAEEGSPPKVIEVLRALKNELLSCHARRIRVTKIRSTLARAGYAFPHSSFYVAWQQFLAENGFVRNGQTSLRRPLDAFARYGNSGPGSKQLRAAAASAASTSALVRVGRSSVSELLQSKGI